MQYKLINKNSCSKNGIKKEGESCTLNNNCTFPSCQETNLFSEDDMVEFSIWLFSSEEPLKIWETEEYISSKSTTNKKEELEFDKKQFKELLELWKSQRIKTLYYE